MSSVIYEYSHKDEHIVTLEEQEDIVNWARNN